MRIGEAHKKLINGEGSCSVPMWMGGLPAGFCNKPSFGERPEPEYYWWNYCANEQMRSDNKYNGYVPALACKIHGGPDKKEALNLCDFCENDFGACKSDPMFGCGKGNDNIFECDTFKSN